MTTTLTTAIRKAADLADALTDMGQEVIGIMGLGSVPGIEAQVQVHRMLLCEEEMQRLCLVAGLDHRVDPVTAEHTSNYDSESYDFGSVRVLTLTPPRSRESVLVQDCESFA